MKTLKLSGKIKTINFNEEPIITHQKILYGVRLGNEDWQEEILCTQPKLFEEVKILASKDGFYRFRVAEINLTEKPDFRKAVNI